MAETYIYLIHDSIVKAYKIGYSNNPIARLNQLQTGSARSTLKLLYTFAAESSLEAEIHEYLYDYRLQGEWFEECEAVLSIFLEFMVDSNQLDKLPFNHNLCYFKNVLDAETPNILFTRGYYEPHRNDWNRMKYNKSSYLAVRCSRHILKMVMKSIMNEGWEHVKDSAVPENVKNNKGKE